MDPPAAYGQAVEAALGRLPSRPFAGASLDDIARSAGIGEADLRSRYADRERLLCELLSPLLSALLQLSTSASAADLRQAHAVRAVIDGYMDALLVHRPLLDIVLADPMAENSESVQLVRRAMSSLRDQLAQGTGSELEGRIRAASALGAVQAAVLEPAEFDAATVRDVIAEAAVAILLS